MSKQFTCILLSMGVLLSGSSFGRAQSERTPQSLAAPCEALAGVDFSSIDQAPTQILGAQLVDPKDGLPAFCEAWGYVTPNVGFNLRLPAADWNAKFFMRGCGGSCGTTDHAACDDPLRKGYACIVSDTGHRGNLLDGLWADNNLQAQVDFGYRGVHVVAVAGKAITERYYGKAPRHAYFMGASTGGRQALVAAQRFPWDFDGIIARAPWIDDTDSTMAMVWTIRALRGADGKSILSHADLQLIHEAALSQCDMDDGVRDGLISNPLACTFDPTRLICRASMKVGCLTAAQADAVKKAYAGPMNSRGEKTFVRGVMPGSERVWDWIIPTAPEAAYGSKSIIEIWATEYFRYMIMPALGSSWQLTDFDFDRDYKRLGATSESLLNAGNPDLRKFKAAGGKLIVVHGWNDPLGSIPGRTIDYYETVERTMGGRAATQDFFRLFMVPGMSHGCGLEGACVIDYLDALEAWVEHGKAPDKLVGARVSDAYLAAQASQAKYPAHWAVPDELSKALAQDRLRFPLDPVIPVSFTRPIYPYPFYAKYSGRGDPNKAESFVPTKQ